MCECVRRHRYKSDGTHVCVWGGGQRGAVPDDGVEWVGVGGGGKPPCKATAEKAKSGSLGGGYRKDVDKGEALKRVVQTWCVSVCGRSQVHAAGGKAV